MLQQSRFFVYTLWIIRVWINFFNFYKHLTIIECLLYIIYFNIFRKDCTLKKRQRDHYLARCSSIFQKKEIRKTRIVQQCIRINFL